MRWSITAWSSPEVSSRPIASSASVSCRRRSPAAAARSRSTATAARSPMLLHSAASVAPSAGPSRRPTSRAPIGSPAWTTGVATHEMRAQVSRRGSVGQARCAATSVDEHGRPSLEGQGGRSAAAQGELERAHQSRGTAVARDQAQVRLAVDPQEDRGQVGTDGGARDARRRAPSPRGPRSPPADRERQPGPSARSCSCCPPKPARRVPHGHQSIFAGAEPGDTVGFDTRDAADFHYTPRDRRRHKPAGSSRLARRPRRNHQRHAHLHRPAVDTGSRAAYGTGRDGGGDHGA